MPAYHVHLKCEGEYGLHLPLSHSKPLCATASECHVNYHHNYTVSGSSNTPYTRTYYDGIPNFVQVGEHQFVERKVIDLWISLMLISWYVNLMSHLHSLLTIYRRTSATNCAQLYNTSLAKEHEKPTHWSFGFKLTSEHVWDGFLTLSLLEDHQARLETLVVPHDGLQKDRFTVAVRARNARIQLYGQEETRHYCNKCIRTYTNAKGEGMLLTQVHLKRLTDHLQLIVKFQLSLLMGSQLGTRVVDSTTVNVHSQAIETAIAPHMSPSIQNVQ